jgi:hypothetical protein
MTTRLSRKFFFKLDIKFASGAVFTSCSHPSLSNTNPADLPLFSPKLAALPPQTLVLSLCFLGSFALLSCFPGDP